MEAKERYKQLKSEIEKEIAGIQLKLDRHEENFERHREWGYTSDLIHVKNKLKAINKFMEYD